MAPQMSELLQEAEEVEAEPQREKNPIAEWRISLAVGSEGWSRGRHAAGGCLSPAEAWEDETLPHSSLLLAKPLSKPLAVKGPCQSTH